MRMKRNFSTIWRHQFCEFCLQENIKKISNCLNFCNKLAQLCFSPKPRRRNLLWVTSLSKIKQMNVSDVTESPISVCEAIGKKNNQLLCRQARQKIRHSEMKRERLMLQSHGFNFPPLCMKGSTDSRLIKKLHCS